MMRSPFLSFVYVALLIAGAADAVSVGSAPAPVSAPSTVVSSVVSSAVSSAIPSSGAPAPKSSAPLSQTSPALSSAAPPTVNLTSSAQPSSFTSAPANVSASGSALPPSSILSTSAAGNSTSNGTSVPVASGPGVSSTVINGYNAQITPNPADKHTFSPFPTPTQQPVAGIFVQVDPSNPPPVSSDPQVLPDFNGAWATARAKAKQLISSWTIEQKANVSTGVGWEGGRCVGNTPAIPEHNWPGLCLEDSPLGVRDVDFATVFPAGINAAATWQRSLIRQRGVAMGQEHKGKGVNIALGPMMNMGRVAAAGRNWEGFGADPFLSGEAAYETILGMQAGGVQACAKHYINNEQEFDRTSESSNVDDRTEHEIYAHPFLRSVMAGVASVMCSYNLANHTFACENDRTLNQILKSEFGFQGFVMSDWSATHSTLSAISGLDMTMPGDIVFFSGNSWFGGNLTAFVQNGSIPEARLDDMAERIVAGWYLLHQDSASYPDVSFNAFNPVDPATNAHVDVQADHADIVRTIGGASTVLLKNLNNTLPLNKPRSLALIGSDAGPMQGGPNEFADRGGDDGILAIGWGSGTANFTYLVDPLQAIQLRARQDRTTVNWHLNDFDLDGAGNIAIQADHALVFINSDSGEQYINVAGNQGDRNNLTAWHGGNNLVLAVAAQNSRTIVVVHSVGPLIIEPWVEHPNVTAIVWAGLGGTETGNGLVDVLYGAVNPSARLPYTIAKDASDYIPITMGSAAFIDVDYTEGLLIDYRRFDALNITPRYEFGFGLSYTTFGYSGLHVSEIGSSFSQNLVSAWKASKPSPSGPGSSQALWLHEPAYRVTFTVKNTGHLSGTEIPQLYINHPASAGEPPSVLKGFTDVELKPGQSQLVSITLSRYDLSIWDVVSQSWVRPVGTIGLTVGASSRDGRLRGSIPS